MIDRLRRGAVHPFLFAAYPILFLFGQNQAEVGYGELWPPLLASLAGAAVVFGVLRLVLRDTNRAAILTTAGLVAFFGFGHALDFLGPLGVNPGPLLLATGLVLAGVLVLVLRRRTGWAGATRGANALGTILVVLSLATIGVNQVQAGGGSAAGPGTSPDPAGGSGASPTDRDIYYIVLDRYGSQHVLETYEGVTETALYDRLPGLGFTVVPDAQTNYPRTLHSLAASLNMTYLDELAAREGPQAKTTRPLVDLIQDHAVGRFLKARGYTYVHLGSWWDPTESNRLADVNPRFDTGSDFLATLGDTTILPELLGRLRRLGLPISGGPVDAYRRHYDAASFQFARLDKLAAIEGPKFVFMHILLPHDPYVFERDGRFVTREARAGRSHDELFSDQLAYADKRIGDFLQQIVAVPEARQPIVVLMADEGPSPRRYDGEGGSFRWDLATPAELDEKFGILAAFHLPGPDAPVPHPGISPVNAFRMILGSYFGADLPQLPDRHFVFRDRDHPYDLIDMSDKVRAAAGLP